MRWPASLEGELDLRVHSLGYGLAEEKSDCIDQQVQVCSPREAEKAPRGETLGLYVANHFFLRRQARD
jgi:hypothetical protein